MSVIDQGKDGLYVTNPAGTPNSVTLGGGGINPNPNPNPNPFTPLSLGPVLWLNGRAGVVDAGGGNCSAWNDQSGNSRNFTQATAAQRPTITTAINGKTCLTFNPTNSSNLIQTAGGGGGNTHWSWGDLFTATSPSNWTAFVVWLYTGGVVGAVPFSNCQSWGDAGSGGPFAGVVHGVNSGDATKVDVASFLWQGGAYRTAVATSAAGKVNSAHYTTHTGQNTSLTTGFCTTQLEQGSVVQSANLGASWVGSSATPLSVGTSNGLRAADLYKGSIGEILVFGSLLSNANQLLVQQYLSTQWGI